MRISTQEITTFVRCPILYREGRHHKAIDKRIIEYLRKVIQYLYSFQLAQHGEQCNFNALVKRWNQLWWGKKRPDDEEADKLNNEAYFAMDKYYSTYIDIESEPIAVNWPYQAEIGHHVLTGTWPVVLGKDGGAQIYYPLSQKTTFGLLRDIVIRADVVAMYISTGNPPIEVTHSVFSGGEIKFDSFFPNKDWLNRAMDSVLQVISAIEQGFDWGNCHACKKCDLRNKCTGG